MRRSIGVLVVAAVVLVGCSSSKKASVAAGGSSTASSAGSAGSSSSASSSKAASGGSGNITFTGSFCADGRSAAANSAPAAGLDMAQSVQKSLTELKKFEAEAPAEIKPDVTTIVKAFEQLSSGLTTAGTDPTKLQAALAPLEGQQATLQAAAQRITTYVTTHCK